MSDLYIQSAKFARGIVVPCPACQRNLNADAVRVRGDDAIEIACVSCHQSILTIEVDVPEDGPWPE